jgi:pimeloyl-ACP methyl ester carboxylesterase
MQTLDPREQTFRIAGPNPGLNLFLRHLAPTTAARATPVLYVHGGTFPSALSIAHRFDGVSWRDVLCDAGFAVWGLDFQGFGDSDRYPAMTQPAAANASLCHADDGTRQLAAALAFIRAHHGVARVSLVAHSWGSMPTALAAAAHPDWVDRLVLFGPIARRAPRPEAPALAAEPAWRLVTVPDQWTRFVAEVPRDAPPVLSRDHFARWGEAYLDSDPGSRARDPIGVKIPTGPFADIARAQRGALAYDPAAVTAPVAIIRGEWDSLCTDADAAWLFDAFAASPDRRDIKIARATHLMHLEAMRRALYRETITFLQGDDA